MTSCNKNGMPFCNTRIIDPLEENGGIPVNIQDQTTIPLDEYFTYTLSSFSLSSNTGASGFTVGTFIYDFNATAGHGINVNDEIVLIDNIGNRVLYAKVLAVAVNLITIDRPIDYDFPITTIGNIVSTNMAVDGSVTPQIFTLKDGNLTNDIVRCFLIMTNNVAMDYSRFGGLFALPRGLVLRIINTFQKTIFCFKSDAEISQFCYDLQYAPKAPAGEYGLSARITFGGQDKHGVVLRIDQNDSLQWVVQDDLTGLISLRISAQGHAIQN